MGKVVLWLVVIFAVLFVLRLVNSAKAQRRRKQAPPGIEDMIRCVHCGTYVPRAEAKPGAAGLTCGDTRCLSR
jgi:uncharacterized protein